MPQPNVVYIHSHDTGRYVQPYGHATRTPHMQRFAEQGVLFRQAFCANPTCSPSRAALLTGQCAHSSGMMGLAHRGFSLHDPKQHLAHTLQDAGYHTVQCGMHHVGSLSGYGQELPSGNRHAADVGSAAEAFLREAGRLDRPFFLDVGFFETHRQFPEPDAEHDPRYTLPPAPLPDTPEMRRDMAGYNTMARDLDTGVGQVLNAIDEAGLADDTLVILTTDHGPAFPFMKCHLTDHGIGVMLMMRGPAGFEGGKVVDAMVSHVDLYPTICEITGVDKPTWLQGTSLLPLVTGAVDRLHDEMFAEVNFHAAYQPGRAVRTERYKYIRRFSKRAVPVLPNCDESESKQFYVERDWPERHVPAEQLYDLWYDPNEAGNLADDLAMSHVLADLRGRLDRWMRRTDDPVLAGPLMIPAHASVNLVDQAGPADECKRVTTPTPAE